MMDMEQLKELETLKTFIKYDPLYNESANREGWVEVNSLDEGCSITINADGMNILNPTPYTPISIKFPTELGQLDLCSHHEGYDFSCDSLDALRYAVENINKKEGKNMKLLNMYVEKSEKNIKKYYEKLLDGEYNSREVVKEFKTLCDKFQEDLAKLAEKTANDDIKLIELDYFESGYGIECNPTKEEQEIREKLSEELRNLHDKIDEVNAQLEIIGNDEHSSHHDVNYILHNYGIIDENYKLTPYTPVENKKVKK